MTRILLIDDDEKLGELLKAYFQRFDLQLDTATLPSLGLAKLQRDKPDLVGSEQLARIYIAAVMLGCVRFGTYKSEKGLGDIYHLDCETHEENPSPRWWTKWGKAAALVLAFVA